MRKVDRTRRTVRWLAAAILAGCILAVPAAAGSSGGAADARKLEKAYRMYADYRREFPGVREMEVSEAMRRLAEGTVVFVDIREPEEQAVSRLPSAVTQQAFAADPTRFAGKTVVAYCTIGYRSGLFAREMGGRGIAVHNLRAGLLGWVLAGGRVYDDAGVTRRIHVYGSTWDFPPEGYASVTFSWYERARKK